MLRLMLNICIFTHIFGSIDCQYIRDVPDIDQLSFLKEDEDDFEDSGGEILGEAGRDYPVYDKVPDTGFTCADQQYPGYYADPETKCQAFYICQKGGRSDAFLCPNGTIFNQQVLVCDWWYNFDCSEATKLYGINEMIVRAMDDFRRENGYRGNSGNKIVENNIFKNIPKPTYATPLPTYDQEKYSFDKVAFMPEKSAPISSDYNKNGLTTNIRPIQSDYSSIASGFSSQIDVNKIKPLYATPPNVDTNAIINRLNNRNGIKSAYGVPKIKVTNDELNLYDGRNNKIENGYREGLVKSVYKPNIIRLGNSFRNNYNGNKLYLPPSDNGLNKSYLPPEDEIESEIDIDDEEEFENEKERENGEDLNGTIDEAVEVFQPLNGDIDTARQKDSANLSFLPP